MGQDIISAEDKMDGALFLEEQFGDKEKDVIC